MKNVAKFISASQGHINTAHKGQRFKCTISGCSESFMRKDQLKFHILGHEGKYRFLCYNCGKGFNHKENFTAHEDTHTGDKPYKCGRDLVVLIEWENDRDSSFKIQIILLLFILHSAISTSLNLIYN